MWPLRHCREYQLQAETLLASTGSEAPLSLQADELGAVMNRLYATVALCGLMCAACAPAKDTFSLVAAGGQEALVRDGVPGLVSSKRHTVVLRPLSAEQISNDRPRFVIAILNRGRRPSTFLTSTIEVDAVKPHKRRLKVYSHSELVAEVEAKRNTGIFISALAGAAGAVSASRAGYSHTTGAISQTGPYGTSFGSYSATTYNPAVAQMAANANADRTAGNMAAIEGQAQAALAQLQTTILKDHTIMPGEWHGGVIVVDEPEKGDTGAEYTLSLSFEGEQHSFHVAQNQRRS